jgi:hypothetical protein
MTVRTDWLIEFDQEQIEKIEGASLKRILANRSGREDWAAALAEAKALMAPAAVWDFFPLREIVGARVHLECGSSLGNGPLASVVAGASELILAICTVGSALTARVREHQGERRMLRGLLLDDLGSWAVDVLRQQVCARMETEAAGAGLRVSTCLSPGESEWGLEDQRVIFSLLEGASIGASLSPSLMMNPEKSLSIAMGRGRATMGHEGGSNCEFCTMKDRCVHRSRRAAAMTAGRA